MDLLKLDFEIILPEINATLHFKNNGIVQKFKDKTSKNFGRIDTYVVNRREVNNSIAGCHAVPDDFKQPAFKDFYEYRFKTSLLVLDEATGRYEEINNLQSVVSNAKYKCVLSIENTYLLNIKPEYIRETEFTIEFIESYFYVWIIFRVFFIVTLLLIVGLIILKKIQLRKKKINSSLSTSVSNSSQSTTVSSTSKKNNVPII